MAGVVLTSCGLGRGQNILSDVGTENTYTIGAKNLLPDSSSSSRRWMTVFIGNRMETEPRFLGTACAQTESAFGQGVGFCPSASREDCVQLLLVQQFFPA